MTPTKRYIPVVVVTVVAVFIAAVWAWDADFRPSAPGVTVGQSQPSMGVPYPRASPFAPYRRHKPSPLPPKSGADLVGVGTQSWPGFATAAKIVGDESDGSGVGANGGAGVWLSNHELLVPADGGWLNPPPGGTTLIAPSTTGRLILDVDSGAKREAIDLEMLKGADTVSASPDGKWVLWFRPTYNGLTPPSATTYDGSKTVKWKNEFNGLGSVWLPDSRHWLLCTIVDGGISPYTHSHFGTSGIATFDTVTGKEVDRVIAGVGNVQQVQIDKSGALVMTGTSGFFPSEASLGVPIQRLDLKSAAPTVEQAMIPAPSVPGSQSGDYSLSPTADRILWHFTTYAATRGGALVVHEAHGRTQQATEYDDFYLSKIDGAGLHKLGRLSNGFYHGHPAWSPDGKRIAIVIGRKIVVIALP